MPPSEHPLPNTFETIQRVAANIGYQVIRLDQEMLVGDVIEGIFTSIRLSDAIIADLTSNNPNVYYELGIGHAFQKRTVHVVFSRDEQFRLTYLSMCA